MDVAKVSSEADISKHLVGRILNKDQSAEEEMVSRYHRGLITMLYNRSNDKPLAEDVAQDTWVLVIQKIRAGQLRDPKKLAAFIIQIGKNQLIMSYRKTDRYKHVSDDEVVELADERLSPEQELGNRQLGQTLDVLLNGMRTERDPELLKRFYLIGDSKQDLCVAYGLSEAHFDRVLYRARERFKKLWVQQKEI